MKAHTKTMKTLARYTQLRSSPFRGKGLYNGNAKVIEKANIGIEIFGHVSHTLNANQSTKCLPYGRIC